MNSLRILSLLPAATEMVYLLGLEKYLVGVSHDCDYPPQVKKISQITSSPISNAMTSLEIDMAVKKMGHRGPGVFHIDERLLKKLKPSLILTQELCQVCAVSFNQVRESARILDATPSVILSVSEGSKLYSSASPQDENRLRIVSLEPESMEDILENIRVVGKYTGREKEVSKVVRELRARLGYIKQRLPRFTRNNKKPRVLVIEWLDPTMVAGHWVPEMIEKAGGRMLVTKPGERSRQVSLEELKGLREVDILIVAPCGFDIQRTIKEEELILRVIGGIRGFQGKVYLLDGNAYMTRPGPRIVMGIEILAEIIHPEIFPKKHNKGDWIPINLLREGNRNTLNI